MFDSTFVTY